MKNLYSILFLTLFVNLQLFCNPLPKPIELKISEFMFNSDNTWVLELVDDFLPNPDWFYGGCDSLFICSSIGRAKVKDIQVNNLCGYGYPMLLITPDDLCSPLYINEEGDSITIVHFCCDGRDDVMPKTVLTFGNYPNAMIGKPAEGQSIVSVSNRCGFEDEYSYSYYSKNSKPYLGDCHKPSVSMWGDVQGKIYDKDGLPLSNKTFMFFYGNEVGGTYMYSTDNGGNYKMKVYSNTLILDTIYIKKFPPPPYITLYDMWGIVDFVQMEIEPEDIIDLDIHIIGDLVSSPTVKMSNNPVKLYPNPVERGTMLNYEIDLPVFTADIQLEVLSITGQLLLREKITSSTGTIDLQKEIPGIYILNCVMSGKILYSTRIIITE